MDFTHSMPPYRKPCNGQNPYIPSMFMVNQSSVGAVTKYPDTTTLPNESGSNVLLSSLGASRRASECGGSTGLCSPVGNESLNDAGWYCNQWPTFFSHPDGTSTSRPEDYRATTISSDQTITAVSVNNGGSGYAVPDTFSVDGTGSLASITVTKVDASGSVQSVLLNSGGEYTAASLPPSPYSVSGGSGTGLTLNLTFGAATQNYDVCRPVGFQNVGAGRVWHGAWPFNQNNEASTTNYAVDCLNTSSVLDTKYLTLTVTVSASYGMTQMQDAHSTPDHTSTILSTTSQIWTGGCQSYLSASVDPLSGVITAGHSNSSTLKYQTIDEDFEDMITTDSGANPTDDFPMSVESSPISQVSNLWVNWSAGGCSGSNLLAAIDTVGGSWPNGSISDITNYFLGFNDGRYSVLTVDIATLTNTLFELKVTITTLPPYWQDGDTNSTYFYGSGANTFHFRAELTNPNTRESVDNDCRDNLLSTWMMDNPNHFPQWRTDHSVTTAPFVSRREKPSAASPYEAKGYGQMFDLSQPPDPTTGIRPLRDWFDVNAYDYIWPWGADTSTDVAGLSPVKYDGAIIGAPLPLGTGLPTATHPQYGVYDFRRCNSGGDDCPCESFGFWTLTNLPAHCSQWTPAGLVTYGYGTAYMSRAITVAGDFAVVMQKYAEIMLRPSDGSNDFARPYGADRTLLAYQNLPDGYSLTCDTGTVQMTNDDGATTEPLPLRYPNCPGFGGRLAIDVSDNGSGLARITFSSFDGNTIAAGDPVDICNAQMGYVQENLAVSTIVSDTQIDLPVSASALAGAKFMVPHWLQDNTSGTVRGVKYYFADNTYKGNYLTRGFNSDWAGNTTASAVTASCYTPPVCGAYVVCYSPNGENFPCGITYDMPTPSTAMEYKCVIQQWMSPALWKNKKVCDGVNVVDDTDLLCNVPICEAINAVPTNYGYGQNETAPPLPSDANDISDQPTEPPQGESAGYEPWEVVINCGYCV